jgi:hypothetical protein
MTRGWSRRGWRGTRAIAVGVSVFAIGACTEEPTAPVEPEPELHGAGPLGNLLTWDLPLRSAAQLALPRRARPCDRRLRHLRDDEPHREFEFWVGDWNVTNVNGVPIGTNIVTSELDGCLIQEHWTASNGSRGLSLNAYDRETGMWHQTWASQVPQGVFGRLRPSGNLVDGKLVLTGTRDATGGFTFQDTWTLHPRCRDAGRAPQPGVLCRGPSGRRDPSGGFPGRVVESGRRARPAAGDERHRVGRG